MKSLGEYIAESEREFSQPVRGDYFSINLREETLLETWVCDETEDGIVLHADERAMQLLEEYGYIGQLGVAEGLDDDTNDYYAGYYVDLLSQTQNMSVTDRVDTKLRIKRALESGELKLVDLKSEIRALDSEIVRTKKGVAEGSLNEGQYEMMLRNGQVKKFVAKDDADAKRIAAGHGAKSVIKLKGGVPAGKVAEQGVAEGGPFSYGAKKPRKGSVADLAAQKRKEQEKGKQPVEPKDQMVGTARVTKGVEETQINELSKDTLKSYFVKRYDATKGKVSPDNFEKSTKVVRQDLPRALKKLKDPEYGKQGLAENAEELNVGDPVIITGNVDFHGKTGDIDSFGDMKRFVIVNLYNHGKHSFHSSDVSYNEYADEENIDEDLYQYDKADPYNSEFAPRAGMGRMTLRGWKQQMIKRTAELAQQMAAAGQDIDKAALWDHVYQKLKSMNMDPIAQEIEQAQAELEKIRQRGGIRSRAFNK